MISIEHLRERSSAIREKRAQFFSKLEDLRRALEDALGDVEVYAQTGKATLESLGPDEWVYGYLYYSKGELKVAYRTTEDDFIDSLDKVPKEYQGYKIKELAVCPIEWLETLASQKSVESLMESLNSALAEIEEKATDSFGALDKALIAQSNTVYEDAVVQLKELGDESLHRGWLKARNQIHMDPADSITRTCSYLESICRKIHAELSIQLPPRKDIASLIASTLKELDPIQNREANDDIIRLFGGVKGIIQAVGSLRTHFGSAHGSSPGDYELTEIQARLANDLAAGVSVYLLGLLKQRLNKPLNPTPGSAG